MKICNDCIDVTIKNCYLCSIGQEILEECKAVKKKVASRKTKKENDNARDYYNRHDMVFLK